MDFPMILALMAILAILLTLFIMKPSSKNKELKRIPNYKALFTIGVIWLPIGVASKNPGLWGMGLVFLIAGLANRDKWGQDTKWSDISPSTKKIKIAVIVGLSVLLLLGIVYYIVKSNS